MIFSEIGKTLEVLAEIELKLTVPIQRERITVGGICRSLLATGVDFKFIQFSAIRRNGLKMR